MKSTLRQAYRHVIPRSLRNAVLVRRRAPLWHKAGLIFIHVPKNGGTSINRALYGQFMGHVTLAEIRRYGSRSIQKLPTLALSRNPWDRALSAYNFVRASKTMRDGAQISHPERYRIRSFESFERFVLEWLPQQDLGRADNVFRTQIEFIRGPVTAVEVSYLARLEDMNHATAILSHALGRAVEIPVLNRTQTGRDYRVAYTPAMVEMIASIYSEDVKVLGYDFE